LRRIGFRGDARAELATLRALHRAHATAIPFENLDIHLGVPIQLGIDALERKLVDRCRGGYCFEHNTLAWHALLDIGFEVVACEARVRLGATRVAPRTHMVLLVTLDGVQWLWDTGFGGDTPLEPMPMDGTVDDQGGGVSYRVASDGALRVLQISGVKRAEAEDALGGEWMDMYAFVPEAREPIDFEVANWYTSTHPDSHFVTTVTAQLRTEKGSRVLRNLVYRVTAGAEAEERLVHPEEIVPLLQREFGIALPEGTTFEALERQS
jgi:N-hydroxyarylamine O-acetyltransferase